MKRTLSFAPVLLAAGLGLALAAPESGHASKATDAEAKKEEPRKEQSDKEQTQKEKPQKEKDEKLLPGMSILGNQEAPKSLVIVPWKSSELGDSLGISPLLDDSREPVDRDVFLRALSYYDIRSETTRHDGAPPGGRGAGAAQSDATQPTAAHRRKS